MSRIGRYCKAYPVGRLREFGGWPENLQDVSADYVYLQEDFTVTGGIFLGENVIFDNVTDEWKNFCVNDLKFESPAYRTA